MPENIFKNNSNTIIEQEIAELSALIEQKRSQLEAAHEIISDQELIKETLASNFSEPVGEGVGPEGVVVAAPPVKPTPSGSYLDNLDDSSIEIINNFVSEVPKKGLRASLKNITSYTPFIIDAIHDLLSGSLYTEMKEKGYLK